MDWLLNRAIAHRGLYDNKTVAENSLEAFAAAMNEGYPIELDVHITADEKIVVFHDDDLLRMTGTEKMIKDTTMEELNKLTLKDTKCHIPTLAETLHFVNNTVPLLIEIKYDVPLGKLERPLLALLKQYSGRYAVQSFDPFRMRWFKKQDAKIYRGQLITDFTKKADLPFYKRLFLQSMQIVKISDPHFLSVNKSCLPNPLFAKQRQKEGRFLFAWTIRDQKTFTDMKQYCDSIIFEKFHPLNSVNIHH